MFFVVIAKLPQDCLTAGWLAVSVGGVKSRTAANRRYSQQRQRRTPPHITLQQHRLDLKRKTGQPWDLDDVCDRIEAITGDRPARGTLSAIENGVRGVSAELLSALEQAYELPPGSITTDYTPRSTTAASVEEVA